MKTLQTLLEMAKRSTPHGFYELAKKKYGAEKVKALKWPEIAAVAKENDVLIPPYLRSQKVGRGLFNLVPQDHADAKAPAKKEEPKKPSDDAKPKGKATVEDVKAALKDGIAALRNSPESGRWAEYRSTPEETQGGWWMVDARDWGHWVVPDDAEDDGDYDWKVLAPKSRDAFRKIANDMEAKWKAKGVTLHMSTEEKNWISIQAKVA